MPTSTVEPFANTDKFITFLQSMVKIGRGNAYVNFGRMHTYLRVGPKMIEGERVLCVQLASLSLAPKYQRKGTFTKMVEVISANCDLIIYVEQVLNKGFLAALLRHGFKPARMYDGVLYDVYLPRE